MDKIKWAAKGTEVAKALRSTLPVGITAEDIVFACVGTDRSTGDSLGPLVGSELKRLGYNVVGTIEEPLHAMNLVERVEAIKTEHANKIVVAVDACLGQISSISTINVEKGPLNPGTGVGKELIPVGNYHITGIVNAGGFMEYFVLQNTRLAVVHQLRDAIVSGIRATIPRPTLQKLTRREVKAALRKQGKWAGYLAGNHVAAWHVDDGWALGAWVEVASVEELDDKISNFLLYMDRELGRYVAFYQH